MNIYFNCQYALEIKRLLFYHYARSQAICISLSITKEIEIIELQISKTVNSINTQYTQDDKRNATSE